MGRININDLDRYTEEERPKKSRKVKKMKPTLEERPVANHINKKA